jgi:transcription initiation factor TFIID subunit TAF12
MPPIKIPKSSVSAKSFTKPSTPATPFKPAMNPQGKNMSTRASRAANRKATAAKGNPQQQPQKGTQQQQKGTQQQQQQQKQQQQQQQGTQQEQQQMGSQPQQQMGYQQGGPSYSPMSTGAPYSTSGSGCSFDPGNIHTIATSIQRIAAKSGGKRLFTSRKRNAGRRKTQKRR